MDFIFEHVRRFDWLLMGAIFILMMMGLVTLFSLENASQFPFFVRQLIWVGVGFAALFSISFLDFRFFRAQSGVVLGLYLFTTLLLLFLIISNITFRGVAAWIQIGQVFVQPVEVAKLSLIILLAKFFSNRHIEIYRIRHLIVSGVYFLIPTVLVLLQPDLGSALVLIVIWLSVIVFSGMKFRHIVILGIASILVAGIAWMFVLAPYQKARITSFLNPYNDPKGAGYQMIQSMIAVGSGGLWGKGLGYGSQSHLNFLPEAETDFIFAAFAEEWGFVGVAVMLLLFLVVLFRIIWIGMKSSDSFSRLYVIGFAAFIFSQTFVHVGMNMGVMPITGITLPFVSYGGSSLVSILIGVGILQNIKINSRKQIEDREF
jgi:rod shape determining protein RodA